MFQNTSHTHTHTDTDTYTHTHYHTRTNAHLYTHIHSHMNKKHIHKHKHTIPLVFFNVAQQGPAGGFLRTKLSNELVTKQSPNNKRPRLA